MNKADRFELSVEQAISLMGKKRYVHTFRNSGFMLFGADWEGAGLIDALRKHKDTIEIGGEQSKAMGHGLVFEDKRGVVFVEVDSEKLESLEALTTE